MCLHTVTDNTHIPKASGVGWKVFQSVRSKPSSEYSHGTPYQINQWYEAYAFNSQDKRQGYNTLSYWRGFHIFTTRKGATSWYNSRFHTYHVIHKVKWRHQLAIGSQLGLSIVVAKEIKIIPEK